jgi:3',5'-cyclic AMP phosphodiesterase CpdA
MKIVHITDTHLVVPGATLYGLDPRARLDAAVADINSSQGDATLAVVTGDLTHWGEPEAYVSFAAAIGRLAMPCIAIVGNHDRRAACLAHVPQAPRTADGFVQGVRDVGTHRLICLDTLDETSHAGQMCDKRFAFLKTALAESPPGHGILIFMHHPPFEVGVHVMDQIALTERARFKEVVEPYVGRIRHLFFGHVHRPISGSWAGIPFSTLRGTNHQVAFSLDPNAPHLASHEPPAYAVALVERESVVVHTHDFLDVSPRFLFSHPTIPERDYQLGPVIRHGN